MHIRAGCPARGASRAFFNQFFAKAAAGGGGGPGARARPGPAAAFKLLFPPLTARFTAAVSSYAGPSSHRGSTHSFISLILSFARGAKTAAMATTIFRFTST